LSTVPVSRPSPVALAIRSILAGGAMWALNPPQAQAELPIPASVLVAAGRVLPPAVNGNTMTINQLSDKATLDWQSFNIGAGNTVRFIQPSTSSVALNNIHQSDPSRIFGTLTANGQVFLVNQNGFIFGKDSRVDVNALVATTLNISQDALNTGIANLFDQTRKAALAATDAAGRAARQLYLKDGAGQPVLDGSGKPVKIQILVEQGARIKAEGAGGRIVLAAPSVTNRGSIESPDGQVILAGSQDKVYFQPAASDSGVRGLLVEVGTGGDVTNLGKIVAERGNASLIGYQVTQQGRVSATTSVNLNGSVRLLAREGIQNPQATQGALLPGSTRRSTDLGDGLGLRSKVILGDGSVTAVALDADKKATAVDAQEQPQSRIEIMGHTVVAEAGSAVRAKSGKVQLTASDDPKNPQVQGDSRIYLEKGSRIDASGVRKVELAMDRNVLKVELRNNELRDAPLQKNGILHGATVAVDIRDIGADGRIPIADLSGALARIARNIDERSTEGGSIALSSSGDVIARPGSVVDVSGGSVAYRDGFIETTQLLSGGRVIDIAHADPRQRYDGFLGRLGMLPGLGLKRYEPGYVEGKDGGELSISAFNALLDGILLGKTQSGPHQRDPADQPEGGSLSIDLTAGSAAGRQDVAFAPHTPAAVGVGDAFPSQDGTAAPLVLDPGLFQDAGLHRVAIETNGGIRIAQDSTLALGAGGSLELAASGFDVQGRIVVPSGDVSLEAGEFSPASAITLGRQAGIDVSGRWINDGLDQQQGKALRPLFIDGGSVNLAAEQGDLRLEKGSRIAAGGGARRGLDGSITAGKGGSITLAAATSEAGGAPANLILEGSLQAYALEQGGSLSLRSNRVVIGAGAAPVAAFGENPLVLGEDFFRNGGFGEYDIGSNRHGLTVADGARIQPRQRNLALPEGAANLATGSRLNEAAGVVTLPDPLRHAADLKLSVSQPLGLDSGEVLAVGAGALIRTDLGGRVDLVSETSIRIGGRIDAPAGHIGLTLETPRAEAGYLADQSIWLGEEGRLTARGAFQSLPDPMGLRQGEVYDGGTVELEARRGYIVTAAGSLIDVSGSSADLQFLQRTPGAVGAGLESRPVFSAGGRIGLAAGEGIVADGRLAARSGGGSASGGSLAVALDGGLRNKPSEIGIGTPFPDDRDPGQARSLVLSADAAPALAAGLEAGDDLPADRLSGQALLHAPLINRAGFASLGLKTDALNSRGQYVGAIRFLGDVDLKAGRSITLDSPSLAWSRLEAGDSGQVTLDAPYLALGSTVSRLDQLTGSGSYSSTVAPEAVAGDASLQVNGNGIDLVGGLSFNGFDQVDLNSRGDIRAIGVAGLPATKNYLGELKFTGELTLTGDQVYPATLSEYQITGSGSAKLTVEGTGQPRGPVYSAGGTLILSAPVIDQNGVLAAPMGSLALNASDRLTLGKGSLTTVSAKGLTIPFGRGSTGSNWLFPLTSTGAVNRVIEQPPEKRLSLRSANLNLAEGATVDLSGGGDLYAYEFIAGPGGSVDVLDPTDASFATKFAVIPSVRGISTPYDPLEFPASGLQVGDSVYLGAAAGLEAGWYTLLPAHYALLPGAYLVTPQAGSRDLAAGTSYRLGDGTTVVAGRYGVAGSGIADSRWQGFAVEPGAMARLRSEYRDYSANQFFSDKAAREGTALPSLPKDAGNLVLAATASIALDARLKADPAGGGRGGLVDIDGDRLAVVASKADAANGPAGAVSIVASDLNDLHAPSLLIGGQRSRDRNGVRATVGASSVEVANGASLQGQEILLAARDGVTLESGSRVAAEGKTGAPGEALTIANRATGSADASGDGALLRVSGSGQGEVERSGTVTGRQGVLVVEAGATVKAEGSMLLDSTKDTRFDGKLDMNGGALALKSSQISIGNAPAETSGLVLADAAFTLDQLSLTSAGDLNLYGALNLNAKQLVIDAAAINGYGNAGAAASISADRIVLMNTGAPALTPTGSGPLASLEGIGSAALTLNADEIGLGGGSYSISGFDKVELQAGSLKALDQGSAGKLTVAGDLAIAAGSINGEAGAGAAIDASGHDLSLQGGNRPDRIASGLGVDWSFTADAIGADGALFDLPAGQLALHATQGDVSLGSDSRIDLSGRAVHFGDITQFAGAGSLSLTADRGNVVLASGSAIDLSGADAGKTTGGNAGSVEIKAAAGWLQWDGSIAARAAASSRQGSFGVDAAGFGGLSALSGKLTQAGFGDSVRIRQRSGDLVLAAGDRLQAHEIELQADAGRMELAGDIDASGSQAGQVSVYGHDGIGLSGSILASASGEGEEGGRVTLDNVHRNDGGSGVLNLAGRIDVSGGRGGDGGSIHLRTGRDRLVETVVNARLVGYDANRSALEATRVYDGVETIDADVIAGIKSDTAAYMAGLGAGRNVAGLAVLPGIEVRSGGDLTLAARWDFMDGGWDGASASWRSDWRYADAAGKPSLPGFLTLRAGGDLHIDASLTDAFATAPLPGADPIFRFQDQLQPGPSWSYTLAAGGDVELAPGFSAPHPLDPQGGPVSTQVVVRTGTGSIAVKAGGDIRFTKDPAAAKRAAAIYTAGAPARYTLDDLLAGRIPELPERQAGESLAGYLGRLDGGLVNQLLRYGYLDVTQPGAFLADYPTRGGSIDLRAGGDIEGIQTGQLASDWLVRSGSWDDGSRQATAWGLNLSGDFRDGDVGTDAEGNAVFGKGNRFFNQNVGALGGGDVTVRAGGDVAGLSVMLPTTGKPLGTIDEQGRWQSNGSAVNGGGDLSVSAGGDIVGGEFLVGRGTGTIEAGGDIAPAAGKLGLVLELGEGRFGVRARGALTVGTVFNPTVERQRVLPTGAADSFFFSYSAGSAVDLTSVGGDLSLQNDVRGFMNSRNLAEGSGFEFAVYPSTLRATALGGDIAIGNSATLFPAADGQLQLLAEGSIGTEAAKPMVINVSDADPKLLPGVNNPARELEGSVLEKRYRAKERLDPFTADSTLIHAATPLHQGSTVQSSVIANSGDIAFKALTPTSWFLPGPSEFIAGRDIRNLNLYGQNLAAGDITRIQAGRDFGYESPLDANGLVQALRESKIELGGPGQLQLVAGRDVNLGSSSGITTIGNTRNRSLPGDGGAAVSILAGMAGQADYDGFIEKYGALPRYRDLQAVADRPEPEQLQAVLNVLFKEIKASAGAAAAAPEDQRGAYYRRGFEAIETLFPQGRFKGDLALVFSQIKTLAGGGINLLVPGGKVDVGLAGSNGGIAKSPDQLGIVVQQEGNLHALTQGDFNVNQSRSFTMGGGDIAVWSSKGDIDAGKGAASAISAPPPITQVDGGGNIVTLFPPIVSGSGIQAISPSDGSGRQGSVYLAAPSGIVDAGEAGISGGRIIIAATQVLNSGFIQSSGGTVGVPTALATPVVPAGADSAASGAAKSAMQTADDGKSRDQDCDDGDGSKDCKDKQKTAISILSADIVGYGQCSVADVRDGKQGCGG
jgi:filamentous hemagglutinin family protein